MHADGLRKKSIKQLQKLLEDTKKELEKYKIDLIKEKENDVQKIKLLKKDCARILTVINEKRGEENA